ncbi:alpha-glucuronidase [Micromonospora sp. LOL_015]|uniref:alpha-glucuronidase n=1 Tax=Micromonospora sp. LOL_015 TaxID=3345416 RepID=UPI003A869CDD
MAAAAPADDVHPAWLPAQAWRAIGSRHTLVSGTEKSVATVYAEVQAACDRFGGSVTRLSVDGEADLMLALTGAAGPGATAGAVDDLGEEGYTIGRAGSLTTVTAAAPAGLLYGLFHVVRLGESAFGDDMATRTHRPAIRRRMLDHWDNVDVHPVMGQVERGYAGGSIFWRDGAITDDTDRVRAYARLLAASGVNAVTINNVNVGRTEARLLTDRLDDVATFAGIFRPYGIRLHLSVTFAAPMVLGGLATADPLDEAVRDWWAATTAQVYARVPDFGGFVVKADSEGQPGPFAYGRSHADGANLLADALAPYGGVAHWRAFVYNHRQDWRDRTTDRARAAYDQFAPLDGQFRDNAIVQVKYGPIDFQPREPVSPVIGAMPATRLAVELQVTQEYTGHQLHVCYLPPLWSEILGFRFDGDSLEADGDISGDLGSSVAAIARRGGTLAAVSNVGDDPFWCGHPLAQANLYAFGRLGWDPTADPAALLDEWIDLTFPVGDAAGSVADPGRLRQALHAIMDGSWRTYERYTAPLGVGFMVSPGNHYGPSVDGYEYSRWGTYHFADRDGVGVDRTRATGTGYTGQYPKPWSEVYESLTDCPDELLLFFHHVPYDHLLHSGSTVIQHIYDTHFAGVDEAIAMRERWLDIADTGLDPALYARVADRLDEQVRSAREWRDQINTYFFRKSGIPDALGRRIH